MHRASLLIAIGAALAALAAGCGGGDADAGPDALLERGWQAYSTGDFDVAIDAFAAVVRAAPSAEQTYSALLGLATTQHLRSNPDLDEAAKYYTQLGRLDTDEARKQSLLGLALVELVQGQTGEGQARLTELARDFPESREADEATIYLAESLLRPRPAPGATGGFKLASDSLARRGARVLEERIEAYPANGLAAAMHMMLGDYYMSAGQMRKAVDHLIAAEEEGISVIKTRSIVLWQVARIAEKELRDYELAERYYALYVKEFGRTALYYRALTSLERVRALRAEAGA